jgi:hypothetical protein
LQAFGKEIYHVAFRGIWAQPLKAKCSTDQESHSSRKCLPGAGQQHCVAFITSPRSWIRTLMTLKPGLIFKSKLCQVPEGGAHKAFNCVKGSTLNVSGLLQSAKIMTDYWARDFYFDRASGKVGGWLGDWDDWYTILQPCWYVRIGTWRHHLRDNISPQTYNLRTYCIVLQETGNNALEFRRVGLADPTGYGKTGKIKRKATKWSTSQLCKSREDGQMDIDERFRD